MDAFVNTQDAAEKEYLDIRKKPVYEAVKRLLDVVLSLAALLVLAVPLAVVSVVILVDSPGAPPIFAQKRVGKNGREFRFYKFRSMVPGADAMLEELLEDNEMEGPVFKIRDDPRITRVGRFLRKSSMDELPQLWNVVKGDMSLVGPRPPLPREVAEYTEYHRQRLKVIPGITCFWQVQPRRNDLSFEQWVELDLKYITQRSILTDICILFRTVRAVFGMEGV